MPELPEVQVMVNQLSARLRGQIIHRVEVRDAKIRLPVARLRGRQIQDVRRRAKYIIIDLDDQDHLLVHLRMTGWFEFTPPPRYRLRIETSAVSAWFVDSRRFGHVTFLTTADLRLKLAALGPEPLVEQCDLEGLRGSRRPVKVALLDQHVIAGVGNIYASESLWAAKISPRRCAASLTLADRRRLHRSMAKVMRRAIEWGDAILTNYSYLAVYGRQGKPCRRRCGGVIRRIVQQQRSTFYCPDCQGK